MLSVAVSATVAGADDGERPRPRPPIPLPAGTAVGPAAVSLGGPYTYWNWPGNRDYTSFSQRVSIASTTTPGAPFFWSYQFTTPIDQGYIGLQDSSAPNGTKIALFSIWNADGARGTNCGTFGGEGVGWSCRIDPYNWVPDREYVVRVAEVDGDGPGQWYRGSVRDAVTGVSREIGRIHLPPGGTGSFRGWVSWTEFFGTRPPTCREMPRARVRFWYPTANAGSIRVAGHLNEVDQGDCRARIEDVTGGVQQLYPK
jgi:hypothetical protein